MRELKKIALIQAGINEYSGSSKKFMYTNITCPTIAATIPENIDIKIIDMYVQDIDYDSIDADLVMVTSLSTYASIAFTVAEEIRKRGITVIIGGVHAAVCPDECAQYFDSIVIGEAELLMDQILSDFKNGKLEKKYETKEQMDLTKCKMPRYDLLDFHKYSYSAIIASKGCYFDCDFCSSRLITGAGFRHKTVEQVIGEIKYLQQLHEKDTTVPDYLFFADSNLYADRKFLIELLNALIPLNLRHWGMFASVNVANDEEVLDLLEKANCEMLQIGFESINPASLKSVNKKQNNPANYKFIVEKLASKRIYAYGTFIFGFDDDDTNVFEETITAIEDANFIMTGFFILTPFPGTRVFERLKSEGRILHYDWSKYNMDDVNYIPKKMNADEMRKGLKYVRARASDPKRLIASLEKFNEISGKKPALQADEKIALVLAYIFRFFKLTPRTRYFIRKIVSNSGLAEYNQVANLISRIQNPVI